MQPATTTSDPAFVAALLSNLDRTVAMLVRKGAEDQLRAILERHILELDEERRHLAADADAVPPAADAVVGDLRHALGRVLQESGVALPRGVVMAALAHVMADTIAGEPILRQIMWSNQTFIGLDGIIHQRRRQQREDT